MTTPVSLDLRPSNLRSIGIDSPRSGGLGNPPQTIAIPVSAWGGLLCPQHLRQVSFQLLLCHRSPVHDLHDAVAVHDVGGRQR